MHGVTDQPLAIADLAGLPDFRVGAALARPARRTIGGASGPVTVEPRIMQLLVVLAAAGGEVLTREQLTLRCWGGVFVAEDSLNRAVSELRRALRAAGEPDAIETISKVGYRLAIATTPVPSPEPAALAASPLPRAAPSRRGLVLGAGALAVAAAGGIGWWRLGRDPSADEVKALMSQSEQALRSGLPDGFAGGIAALEQATRLQPDNAELWGRLALARARADEHRVSGEKVAPLSLVQDAVQRALALDPGSIDAPAALAIMLPYYGDWLAAEKRFDAVLARDRTHLATLDSHAFLLTAVGRTRAAAERRLAFSGRDPFDAGLLYRQVYAEWMLGRIGDADRTASRGLELWPRHPGIWFARLWVLAGTGRLDRALTLVEDAADRPALPPPMLAALGQTMRAALSGSREDRDAAVAASLRLVSASPSAVVQTMMLLNILGAVDAAFGLADAYYLERGPVRAAVTWGTNQPVAPDQRRRKTNMLFVPSAATMQDDPRFAPLMREMGLADYWQRRGVVPDWQGAEPVRATP